jgi:hypothetical protein
MVGDLAQQTPAFHSETRLLSSKTCLLHARNCAAQRLGAPQVTIEEAEIFRPLFRCLPELSPARHYQHEGL